MRPDIVEVLKDLHPQRVEVLPDVKDEKSITFEPTQFYAILQTGPSPSSTGPTPWSYELFRLLSYSEDESPNPFATDLMAVTELIANGKCGLASWWIQPTLTLISKKGRGVRPIAVDNVFIRLTGRVLARIFWK